MGAIVAVIGLELAQTAASMSGLLPQGDTPVDPSTLIISITTLSVTILLRGSVPWIFINYSYSYRFLSWICLILFHGDCGLDAHCRCAMVCGS